jgi:peptide/nickel transport system ATP-binding protein
MTAAVPILEVKNLTTVFRSDEDEIKAVNDVSFELYPGETLGIVGESGSGKSVTSLSIMRLIADPPGKISGGEIWYRSRQGDKVNLLALSNKQIRHYRGNEIAMIFQEPMTSLNPVFTCGNQVMEAIMLHQHVSKRVARQRTIDLFKEVQLPRPEQMVDAYPHQLSGGQKQRVMIAMAISCQPAILIADEPTTALDVTVQKNIIDLLHRIKEERGMSIIFITHDLGVIADIAARTLVMYKGRIVEQGSTMELFRNPQHPYTKGLLACRPPLNKKLLRLPTMRDFVIEDAEGGFTAAGKTIDAIIAEKLMPEGYEATHRAALYKNPPLLRIEDIKTWFPVKKGIFGRVKDHIRAVDGVSFEVYPGEVLGLVGESGCGKTTLGRSILRLEEPTSGSIHFDNTDIRSLEGNALRKMRKHMQIIFQDPYSSLNPRLTIGYAISEPMYVHNLHGNDKNRKQKTLELLDKVGLSQKAYYRYPHEFSGGQRQRIGIARALALEPKFIICDESVSALDVSVQAQVLNLLNDLKTEFGLTYIFISHDLSVVKFMSDRIIVMNSGKIEEIGTPEEIYLSPKSVYTQKLIDALPGANG